MLNGIKAVLFDLDGTLIDSMWLWGDIDDEYLNRFGIERPDDLQSKIEGMSFSDTACYFKERFNIEDSIEKIKEDWNRMAWDKYANEVNMKVGAIEFLKYLKNKNIKMGIATSNSRELVDLILEKHNLHGYFDTVRTSCEVKKGKPAPDIYLQAAKDIGVKPEECLVFEDIIQGIMAGLSANMKVCAVYDEYSLEFDAEKRQMANYYINNYEVLL